MSKVEVNKYSMFAPTSGRKLSFDYPELKNYSEIKDLKKGEQIFCWYLGCNVSPLYEFYNDKETREKAVKKAYELSFKEGEPQMQKELRKKIDNGDMPSVYQKAIDRFEKFELNSRIRAKKMVDKVMENLEKLIDTDVDGEEFLVVDKDGLHTGEVDWDKKKKYADMAINISKNLADIQKQAEDGHYVTEQGEAESVDFKEDGSFLDQYHDEIG